VSVRATTRLTGGELMQAFRVRCHADRSPYAASEGARATEIILPLRGMFMYEIQGHEIVADVTSAVVVGYGDEYRVSHPIDGGDECIVLVAAPVVLEEAFGDVGGRCGHRTPATQLALHHLAALERIAIDALRSDETCLGVLDRVARDVKSDRRSEPRMTDAARRQARLAQTLLAGDPTAIWRLASLAREVGCSPFHLARLFRATTGTSIHRYLTRLRLAIALGRLAQGETDLSRLAADLGFAHHSHFGAAFRATFGLGPAQARRTLSSSDWTEMSTFLIAREGRAA